MSGHTASQGKKHQGTPIPIRFDDSDEAGLRELKRLTGLSLSDIIRRSVRYAVPLFCDGSVNLLTLRPDKKLRDTPPSKKI